MFPIVEPRQRPERFLLNRFSPLAEVAEFLGLGGMGCIGSAIYPDATQLLGRNPSHGTLTNMDQATDWVWSPELGRAVIRNWNTSSGYCDVPFANASSVWPTLTIMAWCYCDTTANNQYFVGADMASAPYGWGLRIDGNTPGQLSWLFNNQATTGAATRAHPGAGTWFHSCGTYRSGAQKAYFNGVEFGTPGSLAGDCAFYSTPSVGRSPSFGRNLDGGLSDVMAFSDVLSPDIIKSFADPSNVMLSVGGVDFILPPRRETFPAAVAEPSGFKPYWARNVNTLIGGGVS